MEYNTEKLIILKIAYYAEKIQYFFYIYLKDKYRA